jgi:hypothetical protein
MVELPPAAASCNSFWTLAFICRHVQDFLGKWVPRGACQSFNVTHRLSNKISAFWVVVHRLSPSGGGLGGQVPVKQIISENFWRGGTISGHREKV